MKYRIFYAVTIVLFYCSLIYARDYQLGIMGGAPIGVTGKYWLSERTAVSAHVGIMDDRIIHVSHLWTYAKFHRKLKDLEKYIDYYYVGAGGVVKNGKGDRVGIAFPLGIVKEVTFLKLPLSISLEASPVYRLSPSFGFNVDGGLIIEYRFSGR